MRRFDPGPRLHTSQQLTTIDSRDCILWLPIGAFIVLSPLPGQGLAAQLSTQGLRRQARRFVQEMNAELEKNVGARVSKALLRRLDWNMSFRYPRCSPVPQKTPRDLRKPKLLHYRMKSGLYPTRRAIDFACVKCSR